MSSEGCRSICVGQKYTCYVLKYLSTKSSIQCRCANKFEFEQKRSLAVCMCVRKHTHIHAHTHTGLCKHTRTLTQKKGWFIVRWEQQALVPSFVKINVFVNVRGWGHLCFKKKYLCQHLTELVQTKSRGVSKTFLLFRYCPCPYHHMLPPITNPSHPQAIRPLSPIRLIHKQSAPYHQSVSSTSNPPPITSNITPIVASPHSPSWIFPIDTHPILTTCPIDTTVSIC